jgi:hypothetical protein
LEGLGMEILRGIGIYGKAKFNVRPFKVACHDGAST